MTRWIDEGRYARLCPSCGGRFEETKALAREIRMERCKTCPQFSLRTILADREQPVASEAAKARKRARACQRWRERKAALKESRA